MIEETLDYLYGLKREGIKLDLEATREFANHLGNPEKNFKNIHVAGTNGKGSISSYTYNILRQKYDTGLYTSPHLIDFNERFIFNKEMISNDYITSFINENRKYIEEMGIKKRNPTFFEATTVMAFKYFSDKKADYGVIEVGLGGRLDSTNILSPEVSIIGQIGYEHYQRLGCSLTSIAYEKGGIIKENKPVVLLDNKPEVVREIKKLSDIRNSKLILIDDYCKISDLKYDISNLSFTLKTEYNEYNINAVNSGLFQIKNIEASVSAIELLNENKIDKKDIERGINESRWPARFEVVNTDPLIIMDSSHNPPAANALVKSFNQIVNKKPLLVIGMLSDKDFFSYLSIMSKLSDDIVLTRPDEPERSLDPYEIRKYVKDLFKTITVINDPIEAYNYAIKNSSCILVTGSMYLVGMLKKYINSPVMPFAIN